MRVPAVAFFPALGGRAAARSGGPTLRHPPLRWVGLTQGGQALHPRPIRVGFKRGPGLPFPARDGKRASVEGKPGTSFGMFPSRMRREILWDARQLAEAGGRRPHAMVEAASKAKRARTTSAATTQKDDDTDND